MGGCSEGIEASGGSGSRKAHHVGISPQEDRSGAEKTVGEGTGGAEESCLEPPNKTPQGALVALGAYR